MSENSKPGSDDPQNAEEQELCSKCLAPNQPGSHFCCKCGAPLSSYAATGPFESLFAEGHLYRRATEQPRNLVVVLGVWVIFGTLALAGAAIAVISWSMSNHLGVFFGIASFALGAFLLAKTTRNYRNRPLHKDGDNN